MSSNIRRGSSLRGSVVPKKRLAGVNWRFKRLCREDLRRNRCLIVDQPSQSNDHLGRPKGPKSEIFLPLVAKKEPPSANWSKARRAGAPG